VTDVLVPWSVIDYFWKLYSLFIYFGTNLKLNQSGLLVKQRYQYVFIQIIY
jgi:hypothetical protein